MTPALVTYTFQNFPLTPDLCSPPPVIFHNLKQDFRRFMFLLREAQPTYILGFAKSSRKKSYFETTAINQFQQTKKVSSSGRKAYTLYYPPDGFKSIGISSHPTHSFCNWTMYKIAEAISKTEMKLMFVHISPESTQELAEFILSLK